MIKEVFLTTLTGTLVGVVFSLLRLPIPAPPVFAGLMGIFGLWLGYGIVGRLS
jgi:XapX domain-containing protein